MKMMFLDESGDHSLDKIDSTYPIFVLAGCIFDFEYYHVKVVPEIQALKIKHFGNADVVLRSYDIRKQKNNFSVLVDKTKREAFYADLNSVMSALRYTVIAGAINKHGLKAQGGDPDNPYHLCFRFIMERVVAFLAPMHERVMFRIESRETHNDRRLGQEYETFKKGTSGMKSSEIQARFSDLSFNQKSQNIAGMQIADLVAYPIGKWVMDAKKENKAFEVIKSKIHAEKGDIMGYGLKVLP